MLKFAVFCVILWYVVCDISGDTSSVLADSPMGNLPWIMPSKFDDTDKRLESKGNYYFHAAHQVIYLNSPHGYKDLSSTLGPGLNSDKVIEKMRSDYTVASGIGTHKVHHQKLSWNKARRACVDEGGHLAIIRTDEEHNIIRQLMDKKSIIHAWVGFHDNFEEGDWVTVLDESLSAMAWARPWWTAYPVPDNAGGNENCAILLGNVGGLNDDACTKEFPFVCQISIT